MYPEIKLLKQTASGEFTEDVAGGVLPPGDAGAVEVIPPAVGNRFDSGVAGENIAQDQVVGKPNQMYVATQHAETTVQSTGGAPALFFKNFVSQGTLHAHQYTTGKLQFSGHGSWQEIMAAAYPSIPAKNFQDVNFSLLPNFNFSTGNAYLNNSQIVAFQKRIDGTYYASGDTGNTTPIAQSLMPALIVIDHNPTNGTFAFNALCPFPIDDATGVATGRSGFDDSSRIQPIHVAVIDNNKIFILYESWYDDSNAYLKAVIASWNGTTMTYSAAPIEICGSPYFALRNTTKFKEYYPNYLGYQRMHKIWEHQGYSDPNYAGLVNHVFFSLIHTYYIDDVDEKAICKHHILKIDKSTLVGSVVNTNDTENTKMPNLTDYYQKLNSPSNIAPNSLILIDVYMFNSAFNSGGDRLKTRLQLFEPTGSSLPTIDSFNFDTTTEQRVFPGALS